MTEAKKRKIFVLMSPLRARRGLVGGISVITIFLLVPEDTTCWPVANTSSSYTDHQHIPIVVVTGQVPTPLIGTDAFQEVDTVGITRSCVKHNYLVRDVRDLAPVVHEAFHLAKTGRPGPVVIDIPKDVSAARTSYSRLKNISFPLLERKWPPDPLAVPDTAPAIVKAERPVLYVGGGVVNSGAAETLLALG